MALEPAPVLGDQGQEFLDGLALGLVILLASVAHLTVLIAVERPVAPPATRQRVARLLTCAALLDLVASPKTGDELVVQGHESGQLAWYDLTRISESQG